MSETEYIELLKQSLSTTRDAIQELKRVCVYLQEKIDSTKEFLICEETYKEN